jgi:cell division protein FtsI (penicillin-binding protein 3)
MSDNNTNRFSGNVELSELQGYDSGEIQLGDDEQTRNSKKIRKVINKKAQCIFLVMILFFGICIVKSLMLVVDPDSNAKELSINNKVHYQRADRGKILDTNLVELANDYDYYKLKVDLEGTATFNPNAKNPENKGVAFIARTVASVIKVNKKSLTKTINKAVKDYFNRKPGIPRNFVIADRITVDQKKKIEKLDLSNVLSLEVFATRNYPNNSYGSNIIGVTNHPNTDDTQTGVTGLELEQNEILAGKDGAVEAKWDGLDKTAIPGTETIVQNKENGKDLVTTIDIEVQRYAEDVANEVVHKNGAKFGIVYIQEVKTGNIVAIVDTGSPNPNTVNGYKKAVSQNRNSIQFRMSPGSTSKVVSLSEVLNEGKVKLSTKLQVPMSRDVYGDGIKVVDAESHPDQITAAGVVRYSSNNGIIKATSGLSIKKRYEYLKKYGYFENSGISKYEASTTIAGCDMLAEICYWGSPWSNQVYNNWDYRTRNNIMYGLSINMNLGQQINAYSTIGNYGKKIRANLIKGILNPDKTISKNKLPKQTQVISKSAAKDTMKAMETWYYYHTSKKKKKKKTKNEYRYGVKSGTANDSGQGANETHSTAIGIAPIDAPRYTVGVLFDFKKGTGDHFGSAECLPIFEKLMEYTLKHYKVPKSKGEPKIAKTTW